MDNLKLVDTLNIAKDNHINEKAVKKSGLDQVGDAFKMKQRKVASLPVAANCTSGGESIGNAPKASSARNSMEETLDSNDSEQIHASPNMRTQMFARLHTKPSLHQIRRRHTVPARSIINKDPTTLRSCLKKSRSESKYTSDLNLSSRSVGSERQRRRISFDKIHIREHELTVGDNPSVSGGAPVSLSWKVYSENEMDLDAFETSRCDLRRTKNEFRMPADFRDELLLQIWGVSYKQVKEAKQDARKIHLQRLNSYQYRYADRARVLIETVAHAYKKKVKKSTKMEKELRSWSKAHISGSSLPWQ